MFTPSYFLRLSASFLPFVCIIFITGVANWLLDFHFLSDLLLMHHLVLGISCAPQCVVSEHNLASMLLSFVSDHLVVRVASFVAFCCPERELSWLQVPVLFKEANTCQEVALSNFRLLFSKESSSCWEAFKWTHRCWINVLSLSYKPWVTKGLPRPVPTRCFECLNKKQSWSLQVVYLLAPVWRHQRGEG